MRLISYGAFTVAALVTGSGALGGVCDSELTARISAAEHTAQSLHPEKPAEQRVYASDGAEFTAPQAHWLQQQLRKAVQQCERQHDADAALSLKEAEQLIAAHRRSD